MILVIATFNFILVRAAPGDPAMVMAGQSGAADPKILDDLRKEYGLDKPYLIQLGTHLGRVLSSTSAIPIASAGRYSTSSSSACRRRCC